MLDALTLPGDGGGIDFGVELDGESCGLLSSFPPSIEDIDIPPAGLLDEKDARSRIPANGDAIKGPREA